MNHKAIIPLAVLILSACSSSPNIGEELKPLYNILNEGKEHYLRMELDSCKIKCARVEEFCSNHESDYGVTALRAEVENFKGAVSQGINNREESAQHYENAYHYAMSTHDRVNAPCYCINLADVLRQMGKAPLATFWLQRAITISDSLNMHDFDCAILSQLGQVYTDIGNYKLSEEYFLKAEKICTTGTMDESFLATARCNSYYTRKNYPAALQQASRALSIAKKTEDKLKIKIAEINIGDIYFAMDNLDSAQTYINSSYEFWSSAPDVDDAILFYVNALKAGLLLKQGNIAKAEEMLGRKCDKSRISPIYLNFYNRLMMDLGQKTGDWKSAFRYGKKVEAYQDSILRNTLEMNFSETEARFSRDTTVLHQQIRIGHQSRTISKLYIWLLIIATLAIAAASALYYRRKKTERLYLEELSSLQLENLRRLVSPHSIFNAIYAAKVDDAIMKPLSKILRASIDSAGQVGITIENEMQTTEDIVLFRKALAGTETAFEKCIESDVDLSSVVPAGSVSLFVENSYKHAFAQAGVNDTIRVHISCHDGIIRIDVQDNGCGFNTCEMRGGTGIRNFRRTIEILNRFNSRKASVNIMSSSEGTTVSTSIPQGYRMHI